MNARIPIYQMTFGQAKGKETGLLFSSEVKEYAGQSVLFTVPLLEEPRHPLALVEYFETHLFYFPFLLGEKYIELEAKVEFPELTFIVPGTEFTISFELDFHLFYGYLRWWHFLPYAPQFFPRRSRQLKYVGNATTIVPHNRGFIPLLPVDLFEMDDLYIQHRGTFVGLTPNFGEHSKLG